MSEWTHLPQSWGFSALQITSPHAASTLKPVSHYVCIQSFICFRFLIHSHLTLLPSLFSLFFMHALFLSFKSSPTHSCGIHSLLHSVVPSSSLPPCPLVHSFFLPLPTRALSYSQSRGFLSPLCNVGPFHHSSLSTQSCFCSSLFLHSSAR